MTRMGDEIRRLRRKQRLTQEQLAEMTSNYITQTDVSQLERGHRGRTSPEKIRALAKALGVPYNHLAQLNFDLDVPAAGGEYSPAPDDAINELWEGILAQRPDLATKLRVLRDQNDEVTYRLAVTVIADLLISNVEGVIKLIEGQRGRNL